MASSCLSVRLRGVGQRAWTLEWLATSGAVEIFWISQKPCLVEVGHIDHDTHVVAFLNELFSLPGKAGALVGRAGEVERNAMGKDIIAAPYRAD